MTTTGDMTTEEGSQTFYHTTIRDLSEQTHLLPPNQTGIQPTWEDMDPSEMDQVFIVNRLDAAHGWAEDIHDEQGRYRIYEVAPDESLPLRASGVYAVSRARIVRIAFESATTYLPSDESPSGE
jgi:hypothetical protein